ncbi:MAG: hypothetical protein K1X79_13375 [Oligoflexia bacterium]|nr:hypothetical protein [Oligoflexia bacterium]
MLISDILQFVLNSACSPTTWTCACDVMGGPNNQGGTCPGSVATAVAAAFATEGMWVQANLVHQLLYNGLGLWAPLLYILSAIGGLGSLALGAPPKMYLWFFMGPALYDWLLDNTVKVHGQEWRVADVPQNQREVWKLAEVGLANIVDSMPPPAVHVFKDNKPTLAAEVPSLFVWFDEVVSDVVQGMVAWTGVFSQVASGGTSSNLQGTPSAGENRWYLLSNLKWGILQDITGATLKSPDLRDSFVTFLSSECGENLKRGISQPRFIAAATSKGLNLGATPSVMINYSFLTQLLNGQSVPSPRTLRRFMADNNPGAFRDFNSFFNTIPPFIPILGWTGLSWIDLWGVQDKLNCDAYLWILIQAFRWEAGHIFFQLVKAAPAGISPDDLVFSLFYGWDIKTPPPSPAPIHTSADLRKFVINLILLHLFRNEFGKAPALVDQRFATSTQAESISKGYQREIGAKAKYAEVYTWAMMMPYLQGILLYLLAVAYPFACVLIVMPGMHKTIFTWMSFWGWVKLWDVGFAFCMLIERSLWAMLGNSSNAARVHQYISEMTSWGWVDVTCPGGTPLTSCQIPQVRHSTYFVAQEWLDAVRTFDRSLVLAANLDLDLQNSYYIYIMAALYFAVPAVTGQLVLGARAGAASMINTAIGGAAQEIGKTAGTAAQSEAITQLKANEASVGQAAYAKTMRQSGLGARAIEYGNQGMREDMAASALGTAKSGTNALMQNRALENQDFRANAGVIPAAVTAWAKQYPQQGGGQQPVSTAAQQSTTQTGDPSATASGVDNPSVPGNPAGSLGPQPKAPSVPAPNGSKPLPAAAPSASGGGGVESNLGAFMGAAGGFAKFAATHGAPVLDAAAAAGIAKNSNAMYADQAAGHALQADMDVASFRHSGEGKGFNAAGSRTGEYANFDAEMGRWDALNSFSSQVSGMSAGVYGTFAGNFSPPAKPTQSLNALAMDGLLNTKNTDARAAANFVDPSSGGYRRALNATANDLQKNYGGERAMSAYHSWSPYEAMGYSAKAGAQLAGSDVYGGNRDGGQILSNTNGARSGALSEVDTGRGSALIGTSGAGENHRENIGVNPTTSGSTVAGGIAASTGATNPTTAPGSIR